MNILVLGSGGREHALAWKIAQSSLCSQIFVAPGNAGTAAIAQNVAIQPTDFPAIAAFCKAEAIALLIVGPEEPLVKGIYDYFQADSSLQHIALIAPSQAGAQLEGSKDFAKRFMQQQGIPTAAYRSFQAGDIAEAKSYVRSQQLPIVLKADGLAAGKGVLICQSYEEAEQSLDEMLLEEKFGAASKTVVVEAFLQGIELSVFVLTDGRNYVLLPEAKDYKRIGEQDTGLNTGGMGAVSPVPFADEVFLEKVKERIIVPTIRGLQEANIAYTGFIFIGLMNVQGEPYVIEYNVRLGDPETEVVLPRIASDLVELLQAAAQGQLATAEMRISPQYATTVMLVSGGYPEHYEKHKVMQGLEAAAQESLLFHAGTTLEAGQVLTNGGRVLACTALADSLEEALLKSKKAANLVSFEKKYFRSDIGNDLLSIVSSSL